MEDLDACCGWKRGSSCVCWVTRCCTRCCTVGAHAVACTFKLYRQPWWRCFCCLKRVKSGALEQVTCQAGHVQPLESVHATNSFDSRSSGVQLIGYAPPAINTVCHGLLTTHLETTFLGDDGCISWSGSTTRCIYALYADAPLALSCPSYDPILSYMARLGYMRVGKRSVAHYPTIGACVV